MKREVFILRSQSQAISDMVKTLEEAVSKEDWDTAASAIDVLDGQTICLLDVIGEIQNALEDKK